MGEMSEAVIDGVFCQGCGEYMGEPVGHPVSCAACGGGGLPPEGQKSRRYHSTGTAPGWLKRNGFAGLAEIKNGGQHVILRVGEHRWDWHPARDKWCLDGDWKLGRGQSRAQLAKSLWAAIDGKDPAPWRHLGTGFSKVHLFADMTTVRVSACGRYDGPRLTLDLEEVTCKGCLNSIGSQPGGRHG